MDTVFKNPNSQRPDNRRNTVSVFKLFEVNPNKTLK